AAARCAPAAGRRRAAAALRAAAAGRAALGRLGRRLGLLLDRRLEAPPVRVLALTAALEPVDRLLGLELDRRQIGVGLLPQHDRAEIRLDRRVAGPRPVSVHEHHGEQDTVDQRASHGVTSAFLVPRRRRVVPSRPSVSTSKGNPMIVSMNHTMSWFLVCWIGLSSSETISPENTSSPPSQRMASSTT